MYISLNYGSTSYSLSGGMVLDVKARPQSTTGHIKSSVAIAVKGIGSKYATISLDPKEAKVMAYKLLAASAALEIN